MNRDILRIKTLFNKSRIEISISSEYENKTDKDYSNLEQKLLEERLNILWSKEYLLDNVEALPDGDYPITLFREIPYAAPVVPDGEPIPIRTAKPLLMYIGDDKTLG